MALPKIGSVVSGDNQGSYVRGGARVRPGFAVEPFESSSSHTFVFERSLYSYCASSTLRDSRIAWDELNDALMH